MLFSTTLISTIAIATSMANAAALRRQVTPGVYDLVFTGETGAVQGHDFITFSLYATAAECTAFCDSVPDCGFANSYHDNNGKGGSPLLTCSLYRTCYDESSLTNTGGQTQPDGSVNFITDSDGWCKAAAPEPTTSAEPTTATPEPTSTADPTTAAPEPTTTDAPEPTTTADPTTAAPEPTSTAAEPTATEPAPEPSSTAAEPTATEPATEPAPEPTSTA